MTCLKGSERAQGPRWAWGMRSWNLAGCHGAQLWSQAPWQRPWGKLQLSRCSSSGQTGRRICGRSTDAGQACQEAHPHLTSSQRTLTGGTDHGDAAMEGHGGFQVPKPSWDPLILPGQPTAGRWTQAPHSPADRAHPLMTPGAFLLQNPKFSCGSESSLVSDTWILGSIQTPGVFTVGLRCLASGKCPI